MKIRKANIRHEELLIENVYVYEDKKQQQTLIAVPQLEWSVMMSYEEDIQSFKQRIQFSLEQKVSADTAEELTEKINYWVREM
ncbi:YueH family protein [Priestia abyssalis]|uniref:YueH family protein n=1 Tax=Priestia abyssalis TaxID=1221450 RepID=UPI000994A10B|nr:YueH family protein [Priestia abyssalis]